MRHRQRPPALIAEIRRLRQAHANLGKEKLSSFIQHFCGQHAYAVPSVRTIDRS